MTNYQEVVGSNPGTIYWMEIDIFHIDLLYKLYCCLFEKTEDKRKRGRVGPFKKIKDFLFLKLHKKKG